MLRYRVYSSTHGSSHKYAIDYETDITGIKMRGCISYCERACKYGHITCTTQTNAEKFLAFHLELRNWVLYREKERELLILLRAFSYLITGSVISEKKIAV